MKLIIKNLIPALLVVLMPVGAVAQQQNPQLIFNEANQELQNAKITQALQQYQRLVKSNQLSGALFINMAYSYMQLGQLGKAKYYYLKAERFEETRSEAQAGLEYVNSNLSRQSIVLPALPWQQVLNWLQINMGSVFLLALGLILLNAGVFMFIGAWFIKRPVKILPKIAVAITTCAILILLIGFYTDYRQQRYSKAIMITSQATVREQPGREARLVNKAYEGYTFIVDHRKSGGRGNWNYVQMSNGTDGWIPAENIMIL